MNTRSLFSRTLLVVASAAVLSGAAIAGPAVGTVVGTPAASTTVIQARVISATPVVAQVAMPHQVCYDEQQAVQAQGTGAGALMGAIAGGAVGNAVGRGAGNALATGIGIVGGAILGDKVETNGKTAVQTVRRCEQQNSYENRVVAYNVVYEYNGQQFSTQMAQEPGKTIPLQITLSPAGATTVTPEVQTVSSTTTVVAPPPGYPTYYQPNVVVYPNMWWWGGPGPGPGRGHRW